MILNVEKAKVKVLFNLVSGDVFFLRLQMTDLLLCPHMAFFAMHVHMGKGELGWKEIDR